ncbi:MAG TPA: helix-turn-helix transcriptional regulator, partial [Acidimicrobiales bacterium]|nr:helix-turn-helix transcriptional regulator [Acidimicrobiales bacterium]
MTAAVSVMAASFGEAGVAATPGREWRQGRVWATIIVMSRFPSELRRWRTVRRLSQLELAIRADTTQRHVSFIEQGRS